jgi:hypothetical protein
MIVNPCLQAPSIGTRPPGAPGQGTTCRFSGSCQVVMSSNFQKMNQKNKQHGLRAAYFQNYFQNIETTGFVGSSDY